MEDKTCGFSEHVEDVENTLSGSPAPNETEETETSSTFDFKRKTWASDCSLLVEGKRLFVSKTVLGLASPVFARMFQDKFKEQTCDEIELPGKLYGDMLEFLQCIYPSTVKTIDFGNVFQVLPLVEEYQVTHRKPECEKVLMDFLETNPCTEKVFEVVKAAHLYNMTKISEKSVQVASLRPKLELKSAKLKVKPPVESMLEIWEKKYDILEQEIEQMKKAFEQEKMEMEKEQSKKSNRISELTLRLRESSVGYEVLKSYSQNLARKEGSFDPKHNWKCVCGVLIQDVSSADTNKTCSTVLNFWGKQLTVTAFTSTEKEYYGRHQYEYNVYEWLSVEIKCCGNFKCNVKLQLIVPRRYPPGDDLKIWKDYDLEVKSTKTFILKFEKMNVFRNSDFASDGKLHLILNVFMSEPFPYEI